MCNRWWITLSVLCISTRKNVKSPEIQFLQFSFHINLLPCYASHCLKQVHSLAAFEVIIFCLTIVACDVSVCFFNACYFGFGQVFVCTHEEWTFHTPFRFSTRTSMFQHSHNSMLCSRSTLPQHSIWTYSNQSAQRLQMAKAWKRRCLAWFWNDNNQSLLPRCRKWDKMLESYIETIIDCTAQDELLFWIWRFVSNLPL